MESEIRYHIQIFLDRRISLDDFEDWLASESWDMHLSWGYLAQRLASAVELRLAEFYYGHIQEDELRVELREMLAEMIPDVSSFSATVSLSNKITLALYKVTTADTLTSTSSSVLANDSRPEDDQSYVSFAPQCQTVA